MRLTNPVHKRGYNRPVPCAAYGKDGTLIAVANSIHDLAKMIDRDPSTISRGLNTGSPLYGRVEDDDGSD